MTAVDQIIQWMARLEQQVSASRQGLGAVSGDPRLKGLQQLLQTGQTLLHKLVGVFWAQDASSRPKLVSAYLSVLLTLKLFCDDVYVEASEEAAHLTTEPGKPSPSQLVAGSYQQIIKDWITGSPLIDPATNKGNDVFLPRVSNYIDVPYWRGDIPAAKRPSPRERARQAVQDDLAKIVASNGPRQLSPETDHLLGIVFLLAQLELKLRWEIDQTRQSGVDSWYAAASRPVAAMAEEVLGVLDAAIRAAVAAGRNDVADRLLSARQLNTVNMAVRYSFRRQETRTLLTFFEKQNATGQFPAQDTAIGVNKVKETLFEYAGQPDPDKQENRSALSVSDVIARQAQLLNTRVKAFGLLNASRTTLTDELKKVDIGLQAPRGVLPGNTKQDRRVIVEGLLTGTPGALTIAADTLIPHLEGYRALVGFPLSFAQTDAKGNLELLPSWRRLTKALQSAAVEEKHDHDENGVFSVAETLAGQAEFVTGLLSHEEIRKGFAASLAKTQTVDLQNMEVRCKAWEVLFKQFAGNGHGEAMKLLIAYVQGYLNLYTKHTYFNLRDIGPNYLISNWPTDLTNRKLHDCGVYAVQIAYDLFRAVRTTRGLTLEFRFLTFLNHICLIVYFDNSSFLANNATIYQPTEMKPAGDKESAAFKWGGTAFLTVYNVDYIIFPAVLPNLSIDTNQSDASFKDGIFKMYLNSQGWGLTNDVTIASQYFQAIQKFNAGSAALAQKLPGLTTGRHATPDDWNSATTLALTLYDLSDAMADRKNFVFVNPDLIRKKAIPVVGFGVRPDPSALSKTPTLPMYEIAELLKRKKSAREPLTADQDTLARKRTGQEHADCLSVFFAKGTPCP